MYTFFHLLFRISHVLNCKSFPSFFFFFLYFLILRATYLPTAIRRYKSPVISFLWFWLIFFLIAKDQPAEKKAKQSLCTQFAESFAKWNKKKRNNEKKNEKPKMEERKIS